jgi:Domain of unknown function (DUF4328)
MATTYRFTPPGSLAKILQIALAVTAGLTLISDVWTASLLRSGTFVLNVPEQSRNGTFDPAYWSGTALPAWSSIASLVSWVAIVFWLIWQHQVTANLWARGYAGLKMRPGWAVGWWFIPIANFFMPLLGVLEVDRRSTPDGSARKAGAVVGWWWAVWLGSGILVGIAAAVAVFPELMDEARRLDQQRITTMFDFTAAAHAFAPWLVVSGVTQAIAAALAILVVRRIDAAQRDFGSVLVPVPMRPDAVF